MNRWTRFALTGLLGLGLLSAIIWLPIRQTRHLPQTERVSAETAARDVLIKGIGGSLVFITAFVSWGNLKATQKSTLLAEDRQISERFSKAIEMLSDRSSVHLQLGGIYALERIAKDSVRDQWQVMEILAAFVRDKTSNGTEKDTEKDDSRPYHFRSLSYAIQEQIQNEEYERRFESDEPDPLDLEIVPIANDGYRRSSRIDVQAAISAIGRRGKIPLKEKNHIIDLSRSTLRNIVFSGNYDSVNFYGTHFVCATFRDNASFYNTDFSGTLFENLTAENSFLGTSKFDKSTFITSTFSNVKFEQASFVEAKFSGGTEMNECSFAKAKLKQLELGGKVPTQPMGAEVGFKLVKFEKQSEFKNVVFDGADMTGALLMDTTFECSSFKSAILRETELREIIFKKTNLSGACFEDAILSGNSDEHTTEAQYRRDRLEPGVAFEHTNLQQADMNKAEIHGANFETAENLSITQLKLAKGWKQAKYSSQVEKELGLA
ncbi:MAG: pentapeptide repeat-containing protein [Phormidesmis sp.]